MNVPTREAWNVMTYGDRTLFMLNDELSRYVDAIGRSVHVLRIVEPADFTALGSSCSWEFDCTIRTRAGGKSPREWSVKLELGMQERMKLGRYELFDRALRTLLHAAREHQGFGLPVFRISTRRPHR